MDKVGKEGGITVEDGKGLENDSSWSRHAVRPRYISPYFSTIRTSSLILDDPYVLLHDKKVSSIRDLPAASLEQVARPQPLVIISGRRRRRGARNARGHNIRGILKTVAIKAPGFGDRRKACSKTSRS